MSEALELFYRAEELSRPPGPEALRIQGAVAIASERAGRRVASLQPSSVKAKEADELRVCGKELLAHAHQIPARALRFEYAGRTIELGSSRSVVTNVQAYFRRYCDRRAAASKVPALLRRAKLDRAFLRQASDDLARAE